MCLAIVVTGSAWAHTGADAPRLYLATAGGVALVPESVAGDRLLDGKTVEKGSASIAFDVGWSLAGAVGFHLGSGTRAEGEFSYISAQTRQVGGRDARHFARQPHSTVLSFMANGLFDLDTHTPIRPFVGLGIGLALVTHDFGKLHEPSVLYPEPRGEASGMAIAYQARVGLAYKLTHHLAIHLGYRIFGSHPTLTYLDPAATQRYDSVVRFIPTPALAVQRIELGMTWSLRLFERAHNQSA